jgi:superfamily II RNA helicase
MVDKMNEVIREDHPEFDDIMKCKKKFINLMKSDEWIAGDAGKCIGICESIIHAILYANGNKRQDLNEVIFALKIYHKESENAV